MKIPLILFLFILFLIGCENSSDKKNFKVNFNIQDTTRREIAIGYQENIGLSNMSKYLPIKSKDSNYFVFDSIEKPFKAYINIDEIQFPIWVEPNSNLDIVFEKDTILFSGKSKLYADYYSKSREYWVKIYKRYKNRNPALEGRPSGPGYFNVQDSITVDRMKFLESFFEDQKSVETFIEHEKNNLLYTDIFYKISGLTSLNEFNFYQKSENEPSDDFLKFTDEFEFNNPDLFNIAQYRRCYEWLPNKYLKSNSLDYYKNIEQAYNFVISLPQNELCKKYIEVILLNKLIEDSKESQNYSVKELIEKRFEILKQKNKGIENYLSILRQKYIDLLESEKKSKEPISFLKKKDSLEGTKLRDFSSNKNADFFRKIIQQHPGKVLYVDVWAPWCGPCMKEMFYSAELQKKYDNKNIEFIFLGVSCERDAWKSTIVRRKLTGEHYYLDDEQSNELYKIFEFRGIPRYLIIDKNGVVINSNAPSPSKVKKLDEIFKTMLEE